MPLLSRLFRGKRRDCGGAALADWLNEATAEIADAAMRECPKPAEPVLDRPHKLVRTTAIPELYPGEAFRSIRAPAHSVLTTSSVARLLEFIESGVRHADADTRIEISLEGAGYRLEQYQATEHDPDD